ncbi:hypothetical protein HER32_01005 [Hymenobacter sp. BT18]|uniref:hypothetical protein n=1 Tax=Hymenobacter sp. BT18 TaxID=2835648 RepID=UPI00143EDC0A|nr:hypothetical protein [Hymenobacter sp. BT18]QIX59842.1 hypothetical protein HER32_01005 [Hymenobacter sp. BT18]
MDTAATLSFFQSFYANTPLYVVAEPEPTLPGPTAAEVPAAPVASLPAAVPVAQQPTPAPLAPAPVPVAATAPAPPQAPAPKLPSLGSLKPSNHPTGPALPPVSAATPHPPASAASAPVAPAYQPTNLTLAELPAAAPAPAAQTGRIQPTPTQSPVAHVPFSTLGSNARGLIILVRMSPDQFRKLPRNVFLNNLLKAIRLVMEDVVLVNVEHEKFPVALCSLRQHLHARQFLAFGKNLLDVAVYTTQPYEPVLLYGDTAFLGAGEIDMLEYDAGRKKQLWQAIQRMFLG